ncbi:MAG: ECF-type sigma factor [Gemmatimonadota bacterium]|nr:ECF-type sigma factor [Gemmatimonadota bacterium]
MNDEPGAEGRGSQAADARLTSILKAVNLANPDDASVVMPLVYDELRALADRHLASERRNHTLQPTALVHEVYIRLAEGGPLSVEGRAHFLGIAARAMRQVLIDSARARAAQKRGGGWREVTLDSEHLDAGSVDWDIMDLHTALGRLGAMNPNLERLVELRFFAGLTVAEAAELLGVSPRKAAKDWAAVRLWLRQEMGPG